MRDGLGEHRVVVAREQSDAVGAYQRTAILVADVHDALLELGSLGGLFAEAGRDNDESPHLLLLGKILHVVGTEAGSHHQYGHVGGRKFLDVVDGGYSLHFLFLWVYHAQFAGILSFKQIAHNSAAWLVDVVRAAYYDDALGL